MLRAVSGLQLITRARTVPAALNKVMAGVDGFMRVLEAGSRPQQGIQEGRGDAPRSASRDFAQRNLDQIAPLGAAGNGRARSELDRPARSYRE
jgi:hypothetical protein